MRSFGNQAAMQDGDNEKDRKVKATTVKHATFVEPEKPTDGSVGDSDEDTRSLEVRQYSPN